MRCGFNPEIVLGRPDTPERYFGPKHFSPPFSDAWGHSPFLPKGNGTSGTNKHPSGFSSCLEAFRAIPRECPDQIRIAPAVVGATRVRPVANPRQLERLAADWNEDGTDDPAERYGWKETPHEQGISSKAG
jgi:hypothetical protein